jgi:hypothetical protein
MIKRTAFIMLMICVNDFFLLSMFEVSLAQDRQHPMLGKFPRDRNLKGKIMHTSHIYALRARSGQTMMLHVTSAKGIAYFSLVKSNS